MQDRIVVIVFVLALGISIAAGCYGEIEPLDDGTSGLSDDAGAGAGPGSDSGGATVTWQKAIGPLMVSARCTSCHGTQGNYSLQSYAAALAPGTDNVPNVIAGDASSALIRYCEQRHGGMSASDTKLVSSWVMSGARER